jgi:hypothetical protein
MEGIKELKEGGQYQEYNFANFSNTLTIPNQYPRGKYSAKIKIHDRIGNKTAEATTEFDLQ